MTNGLHGDIQKAYIIQDLLEAEGELHTVSDVDSVDRQNRSNYMLQLVEEDILTLEEFDGDANIYGLNEGLAVEEYGNILENIGVDWE